MRNIEVKILNPDVIAESQKMMVCAARLTQKGHTIKNMADFMDLYNKPFTENTVKNMVRLPHPTIQKFGVINVAVVGASRRFLAQITRHQNEVKFMSASLQYSNYSGEADFAIPYEALASKDATFSYLHTCETAMGEYANAVDEGLGHDAAGYMAPQGLRNILIISATPYQWKHMISQRTCRRNTDETRIVLLKIWQELFNAAPDFFSLQTTGPFCMGGVCKEGTFGCGNPITGIQCPEDILRLDYPRLFLEG